MKKLLIATITTGLLSISAVSAFATSNITIQNNLGSTYQLKKCSINTSTGITKNITFNKTVTMLPSSWLECHDVEIKGHNVHWGEMYISLKKATLPLLSLNQFKYDAKDGYGFPVSKASTTGFIYIPAHIEGNHNITLGTI